MKYSKTSLLLSMAVLIFAISSCSKHRGYKKTDDGLYYKFYTEGDDTTTLKTGMVLTLSMKYSINDSVLFNSNTSPEAFMLPLSEPSYKGDIYTALALMSPGDSASFITSADSFFLKTIRMPQMPDSAYIGKEIIFDVKLISAKTQEQIETERKAEMAVLKSEEETKLAAYLKEKNITTAPLASGLIFTETKKGSGQKPKDGDIATIHFKVSDISGRVFFSSFEQGEPMRWEVGKEFDNAGATEALKLMTKGSKASIVVPSSIGFGEQGRGQMVAPYTTLLYDLEILDFMTKAQYEKEQAAEKKKAEDAKAKAKGEEAGKLESYIKNNKITVKPTASGLYYIETAKGSGASPVSGKKVKVHYTGTLLDGTKFDSSVDRGQPFEFVLGQGQVIKGWDEGIALMKKGGKARLIIPSAIAYGENGRMPTIPPSATLVFDVELLDFK
ncbi:MAG: FKBP-type peptidyl-prolyl cis-trans isomerase [Lentimicrobiaceae bacterium]|nr:FKBP-type peptidyl-prolyl cis-trans isomerase [Lentimicrobiaceae bacterium]MCO5265951.1 FKBP-type peptidyl-prolyl cis-trans isomerase [Lentimicrobium sp.]